MMLDHVSLLWAFLAGLALGGFYFGGLWLTVRRLPAAQHVAPLFLLSFVGRMAVSLGGFYLVMDGDWRRAVACLVGFLVMRMVLTRRWGPARTAAKSAVRPVPADFAKDG